MKGANLIKEKPESKLARRVARYLCKHYPDLVYRFDIAADLPMQSHVASRIKMKYRHKKGYADLFIPMPAFVDGVIYLGLYIELKATKLNVYKQNGQFKSGGHLAEQKKMREYMRKLGYMAEFSWADNDHVYDLIDTYLKNRLKRKLILPPSFKNV